MMKRQTLLSVFAFTSLILLQGCVPQQNTVTQPSTPTVAPQGSFLPASEILATDIDSEKPLVGTNDVLVASFKVGFIESKRADVKAGGGLLGSGFGGKSTALMKMEGLSAATRQQITEYAYNQFMQQLKAQGFNVRSLSELEGREKFQQVNRFEMPFEADNSGFLSDYGVTHYHSPAALGKEVPLYLAEIPGEIGGFGWDGPDGHASDFAKETGVKVITVNYVFDFAYTDSYGGTWTSTSSIDVGTAMQILPGANMRVVKEWGGTFNPGMANVKIDQSVVSDKPYGELSDTTTDLDKGVQLATNVIGALGGIGTNISRNYTLDVNESQFESNAKELVAQVNNNFVDQLVQRR